MADYLVTDTELTGVANAIRTKGGTSAALEWPDGYSQAVAAIPTGITPTGTISITENGTYDVTDYATASVSVSGGGGGSIELASVTLPYTTTYYTDATMTPQTDSGSFNVQMPVGSICVGRGAADPEIPISGITPMASWGSRTTAVHVYKVTG